MGRETYPRGDPRRPLQQAVRSVRAWAMVLTGIGLIQTVVILSLSGVILADGLKWMAAGLLLTLAPGIFYFLCAMDETSTNPVHSQPSSADK